MEKEKAEKYDKHLKRVSEYQKSHPDKCKEKCKKYNEKLKTDPEKYEAMLERKRQYYLNVRKPKLEAEKSKKEEK